MKATSVSVRLRIFLFTFKIPNRHNRTSCSRRTGCEAQNGGGSQPNRASGSDSQSTRGSGAPSAARGHSQAPSAAASHSKRPSVVASSTGTTKKHFS